MGVEMGLQSAIPNRSRMSRLAFGNESTLVALYGAVCVALDLEYPLRTNDLLPNRSRDEFPSPIRAVSVQFLQCCVFPLLCIRTSQGFSIGQWFSIGDRRECNLIAHVSFLNVIINFVVQLCIRQFPPLS